MKTLRKLDALDWLLSLLAVALLASLAWQYAGPARANVGPGFVDSFHVSCATSATVIQSAVAGQYSYDCMVDDAAGADVFIGDSGVTTSTYGGAYGAGEHFGGDVRKEYCVVASGTITVHCRAMIGSDPD